MSMAKSRSESPSLLLSLLRGKRGVMKGFAEGKRTVPGPGISASPDVLALEGRGFKVRVNG
jgi:hypothetical protein